MPSPTKTCRTDAKGDLRNHEVPTSLSRLFEGATRKSRGSEFHSLILKIQNSPGGEVSSTSHGRRCNSHGPQWVNREGKNGGFVFTLTRMDSVLPEGKPLWGGDHAGRRTSKNWMSDRPSENHPEVPDAWEEEIGKAGRGGTYIFSDGRLLEGGMPAVERL